MLRVENWARKIQFVDWNVTKEAILMCIFSVITNENFYCYLYVVCIQKLEMASSVFASRCVCTWNSGNIDKWIFYCRETTIFFWFKCLEITDEKSNFCVQRENVRNIIGHTIWCCIFYSKGLTFLRVNVKESEMGNSIPEERK